MRHIGRKVAPHLFGALLLRHVEQQDNRAADRTARVAHRACKDMTCASVPLKHGVGRSAGERLSRTVSEQFRAGEV